jgi:hypothetical protein
MCSSSSLGAPLSFALRGASEKKRSRNQANARRAHNAILRFLSGSTLDEEAAEIQSNPVSMHPAHSSLGCSMCNYSKQAWVLKKYFKKTSLRL